MNYVYVTQYRDDYIKMQKLMFSKQSTNCALSKNKKILK